MNAPLLEEIDAAGDVSVLRLNHPVLDAEALHTICEQLSQLASRAGRRKLHLDVGGVEYVAPAGLACLLALHTQLLAVGGGLRLCGSDGCIDIDRLGVVMSEG